MTQDPTPKLDAPQPPGLRRMRWLASSVLWFERVWPAVAPAIGIAGVFVCGALLDIPRSLPPSVHMVVLVAFGMAFVAALGFGLRRVQKPRPAEADRRLEADSGLRHQPLAVLDDAPSSGGDQLWAAHVARARAQISRLKLRAPRPMLPALDQRALRALVLVGLAASVGIAGPDTWSRLARAFQPAFAPTPAPPAPLLQAWITPPGYTNQAPVFLKSSGGDVMVPAGSKLQMSLTGGPPSAPGNPPTLQLGGQSVPFAALDANSFQIEQELTTGGHLAVDRRGTEVAGWDLTVMPDSAPVVSFPEQPGGLRNGTNPQARIPWQVTHPYGVASLQAELHLAARPDAPPLILPVPLPGNAPKSAKGARVQDLTAHPWAGLKVTTQLVARDAPGLEGRSEIATFILPERRFTNAVARALVAVRRQLSLTPDATQPAIDELDRLAVLPEVWDDDFGGFLNLRAIAALLSVGQEPTTVPEAQARLWDLALHMEEGAPDRTARALEAARQQLKDALDAEKRDETVDKAELDKRIQALQEALQKRLEALSEQARRDPDSDAYNPDAHPLDQRDMQRLTEDMRDAARQGDNDKARDKMAELDKMMEALMNARPEHGKMTEQERKRAEKRQQGQQQMSALQDMIQREGTLLDRAQSRANGSDLPRRPATPDQVQDTNRRTGDQKTQLALRRAVGELMQQYGDLTGEVPPNLGDADTAMRDGAQALGQGKDLLAADDAKKAIEALQKGGKSMQQQMASKFGRGQSGQSGDEAEDGDPGDGDEGMAQGEGDGDGQGDGPGLGRGYRYGNRPGNQYGDQYGPGQDRPNSGRQHARRPGQQLDPLGRPRGEGVAGSDEAGDVQVPEQMEQARTRALQDELRRRGADRTRRQEELDYIDRLLKQF